jgi:hypothetical protein
MSFSQGMGGQEMITVDELKAKLSNVKKAKNGWKATCPAHDDQTPSLSLSSGSDGRPLVHCHAGCTVAEICAALGIEETGLVPETSDGLNIVSRYDYRDEAGKLVMQVVRLDPKSFRQRRPKQGGGWDWSVKGARVIPYKLDELTKQLTEIVFLPEGEKDVDNLSKLGVLATCNAGGAGKWTDKHSKYLRDRTVVVLSDNDEAGRSHSQKVKQSLEGIAASVAILELPGLPPKGDVSDWLAAGGSKEELLRLASEALAGAVENWPELESFDDLYLPSFPIDVLPPVLREWVSALSEATQTPPDLAGLLTLAVCAAAVAKKVLIEARHGWREPLNIFVAILLEPGNRKSAVFSDTIRPLRILEGNLAKQAKPRIAREQSEYRQKEQRLKKLEKQLAEGVKGISREEADRIAEELSQFSVTAEPRLIVDDATAEVLTILLQQQDGRIASMSAEGGVFDLMGGLYTKNGTPSFNVYLMGHAGDDLVTDRVTRDTVRVAAPALTCAYAVQPQVIEGISGNAAFRGRGLLGRFLFAFPASRIGQREIAPPPVPDSVRVAYYGIVYKLSEANANIGNIESANREFNLRLSSDASREFLAWEAEIESMLGDGGKMELMRDWGGKLAGATLRIAGILHCVQHGMQGQVDAATIKSAIQIARFLIPHAEAVLTMMIATESICLDDAQYVLRWIDRHELTEFTKRDLHQHGKNRFKKVEDLEPALNELVRRGYLRLRPHHPSAPGRPPSPTYEVNPAVRAKNQNSGKRSQYSQNSREIAESCNSENIESAPAPSQIENPPTPAPETACEDATLPDGVCNHAWIDEVAPDGRVRVICGNCGKFYGYKPANSGGASLELGP